MTDKIPIELLEAIKGLTMTVSDFLLADDGNDAPHIEAMNTGVVAVLKRAQRIPALKDWAEQCGRHWLALE